MKHIIFLIQKWWHYGAIFLLFFFFLLRMDLVKPLNFDSSYNLLVVRTLLQEGVYGTDNYIPPGKLRYTTDTRSILTNTPYQISYAATPNKIYSFDTWITTGYPVLGLTAAISYVFGFNYFVPRIVMNLFAIAFIFVVWKTLLEIFHIKSHKTELLLFIIGTTLVFHLDEYMVHTLGEIPAFVFLLSSFLMNKKSSFIAGLLLSLSLITKTMFVYVCLPYFAFSLWGFVKEKSFKKLSLYIGGFIIPIALLLLWITQYYSLSEYAQLLSETLQKQIIPFHYSQLLNPLSLFSKIGTFIAFDSLSFMLMVSFIALLLRYPTMRTKESLALAFVFGYFIIFYSDYIPRHIVLFTFFLTVLFIAMFSKYVLPHSLKNGLFHGNYIFALLVLFIVFFSSSSLIVQNDLLLQKKISYFITSKHPDDTFFFYNWWKAPGIQLLTDKKFIFLHPDTLQFCKGRCYLIVEPEFKKTDSTAYKQMIEGFPAPTYSVAGYDFYELNLR